MKKLTSFILAAAMVFTLTACGNSGGNTNNSSKASSKTSSSNMSEAGKSSDVSSTADTGSAGSAKASSSGTETASSGTSVKESTGNTLVVYFSWSGHLKQMAEWVADETGGDLVQVTAKEAYPEDYEETADRAKKEKDDGTRPEINADLTEEQLAKYDTVFFGFPVWWYDLPMPMWTFLEKYDFSGKTIIPFFSHEGSSSGASAPQTITTLAKGATVRTDDALSIRGGSVADSENEVRTWVKNLGFGK